MKFLDALAHDIRDASRALTASRTYVSWVIGSLATGMAATVAAIAVLNASMVLPFPGVSDQKHLIRIAVSRNCGRPDCWVRMSTRSDYDALREGLTSLQGLAGYSVTDVTAALPDARSMLAVLTSANYFDVLGVRTAMGRGFRPEDEQAHAAVVVISYSTWTREFGADPTTIGRSIRVDDRFVQIVGIAPQFFMGIDRDASGGPRRMAVGRMPDIWLPIWVTDGTTRGLSFVGRLKDNVEESQLRAEANVMAVRLAASRGGATESGVADVRQVRKVNPRTWQFGIIMVMPIPILVLAIACVNAANLMLARGSQRQREMAIRLAIGAARWQIVRQLLVESALLTAAATAIAVPIASWGLQLASTPIGVPIPIDATVLVLSVLTAACTTIGFGLAPAVRVSAQRPSSTLGSGGSRGDALPQQSRSRRALVVAQVALSLGLLATGSQLVATVRSQALSSGTPPSQLLIARFDLEPLDLRPADIDAFYRELVAGASRLPGVEVAGIAGHTAVWAFGRESASDSLTVWRPVDGPDDGHTIAGGYAGGDLFDAVGLRIVSGRAFADADRHLRPQVAVINETAAQSLNGPPIGSTLRVAPRGSSLASSIEVRIVGVVEAAREPRLEPDSQPDAKVYLPSPLQPEPALSLYVRTAGAATRVAQPIRELVSRIAPRVPILEIGSLEEMNERSYATQLWLARAAAFLGIVGLVLATTGLYGVSSYVVAMRAREVAIRMALGATPRAVLTMMLAQSMRIAIIGLIMGGSAAIVASRLIQSELHGIRNIDGAAFAATVALFLAAMLIASAIPAARASRVDPIANLKDA